MIGLEVIFDFDCKGRGSMGIFLGGGNIKMELIFS